MSIYIYICICICIYEGLSGYIDKFYKFACVITENHLMHPGSPHVQLLGLFLHPGGLSELDRLNAHKVNNADELKVKSVDELKVKSKFHRTS